MKDAENSLENQCEYRIARGINVDLSPDKNGVWETLPQIGKLWRIRILSEEAAALHILFDQYLLPDGAELF